MASPRVILPDTRNYRTQPGIIWVRVPRAASRSIARAWGVPDTQSNVHLADVEGLPDRALIMFVRHPLERFVSACAGIFKRPPLGVLHEIMGVEPRLLNRHIRPQWTFAFRPPEFVGRVETIGKDWDELRESYPHLGPIKTGDKSNHDPWRKVFTGKELGMAVEYYARDFEEFDYG